MNDEPTRKAAYRQSGPSEVSPDEVTYVSVPASGRGSYTGDGRSPAGQPGAEDWYTSDALQQSPGRLLSRSRFTWRLPLALCGTAAIGFAAVTGVIAVSRSNDSPQASSTSPTVMKNAGAASAPRTTRASQVAFPAGADHHCTPVNGSKNVSDDPDVAQAPAKISNASCPFLVQTKSDLWAHEASFPDDRTFELQVLSEFRIKNSPGDDPQVHLTCTRSHGVSTCTGGAPTVTIYVRERS